MVFILAFSSVEVVDINVATLSQCGWRPVEVDPTSVGLKGVVRGIESA